MGISESTPTPSVATQLGREQILDATLRCLREDGYDATTIRRIAGHLDCAIGSIYRYFTDKHELLLEVTQRLVRPVADMLDAGGTFDLSVDLYTQLAARDCGSYRLMFWLACNGKTAADRQVDAPPLPAVIHRIIDGWTRLLNDRRLALRCWSMLHGSIVAGLDVREVRDALMDIAQRQPSPHGKVAAPQIVTLVKEPVKRAPSEAGARAAATTRESPVATTVQDDVCLL